MLRFCQIRQDRNWAEYGPVMSLKPANVDRWIPARPIAEVCFYGTMQTGAGWLARVLDRKAGNVPSWSTGLIGTGEPAQGRDFTQALWSALEALLAAGLADGPVAVFEPAGELMATVSLETRPWPCYGDLKWGQALAYVTTTAGLKAEAAR
jgi:hypothetical protein